MHRPPRIAAITRKLRQPRWPETGRLACAGRKRVGVRGRRRARGPGARLDEQAERAAGVGRARRRHERAELVALRLLHKVRALRGARVRTRHPRPPLQAALVDDLRLQLGGAVLLDSLGARSRVGGAQPCRRHCLLHADKRPQTTTGPQTPQVMP